MVSNIHQYQKTIIVLNDLNPKDSPGAAAVSADLARFLENKNLRFIHVSTSKQASFNIRHNPTQILILEKSFEPFIKKMRGRFKCIDSLFRLFSPLYLISFLQVIYRNRVDTIWIHQIGHRFSYFTILLVRLMRKQMVITFHDYSFLRFRKLYPQDLDIPENMIEQELLAHHLNLPNVHKFKLRHPPTIAHRITRFIFKFVNTIVYVSALQKQIFVDNGFPNGFVIENITNECSCEPQTRFVEDCHQLDVLFAGRRIGKGLERTVKEIGNYPKAHLHLAGQQELKHYVEKYLPPHSYTYHGFLNSSQLSELIHKMDLVAVLSDCFDVYPTITLEAFSHGAPAITTLSTGTYRNIHKILPQLAFDQTSDIDFEALRTNLTQYDFIKKCAILSNYFTDKSSISQYIEIFS